MIGPILLKIFSGLISAAGGILFFFGFFDSALPMLSIGILLMALAEGLGIYALRYESDEALQLLRTRFWQELGAAWAFPLLLLIAYALSPGKTTLGFSLAFAVFAFFRSSSLIIKGYLAESRLEK